MFGFRRHFHDLIQHVLDSLSNTSLCCPFSNFQAHQQVIKLSVSMTVNNETKIVDLSPMDTVMSAIGIMILYIYAPTDKHRYNVELFKTSFIETIEQDYEVLLGELFFDPARRGMACVKLEAATLSTGASALPFVTDPAGTQSTDQVLDSLSNDFMPPARKGKHQLVTVKGSLLADGGLVIGIDFAHGILDGEGAFTFGKVWAQRYRRLAGTIAVDGLDVPIKLSHNRYLLTGHGSEASVPHPEFRVLPLSAPNQKYEPMASSPVPVPVVESSAPPSTDQRILHLSFEMLARLKTLASEPTDAANFSYVSAIDSLTALFTVLITRARAHNKDVNITTCVNAREHLQPPLPTNYVGNVIFNALSSYKAAELAPSSRDNLIDALRVVAKRVRQSILRARDDQFLRDTMAFISSQPNMSAVSIGTDFFFGPDIFFTSWVRMGAYDADFGGGKARYAGVPRLAVGDGLVFIADPMYPEKDGLDVIVCLESEAMKRFSEEWEAFSP